MRAKGWLGEVWRTSIARITILYGALFAVGVVALLTVVYWQSALYLDRRLDVILNARFSRLSAHSQAELKQRLEHALAIDGGRVSVYALFRPDGALVTGNLPALSPRLKLDGQAVNLPPSRAFPGGIRAMARRLPSGEVLVLGRDLAQLTETRTILLRVLVWSAVVIIAAAFVCGVSLSIAPLRRVRILQQACGDIAVGNFSRRLPQSTRRDELDMLAATVNHMIEEVERLMLEVRSVADTIAHDLRTPLTTARARLDRLAGRLQGDPVLAEQANAVIEELDAALDRFRALLRISEIEARRRRAGFVTLDPSAIVREAADLYGPVAEAKGVALKARPSPSEPIEADAQLLFEAVSNLVDNAIKFTPSGGRVSVAVAPGPRIVVQDTGPGIPETEQTAVLQPFYRSERDRLAPGSGLGLSIVGAILRLHGFSLSLECATPGLRAVIDCASSARAASLTMPAAG